MLFSVCFAFLCSSNYSHTSGLGSTLSQRNHLVNFEVVVIARAVAFIIELSMVKFNLALKSRTNFEFIEQTSVRLIDF